MSRGYSPKTSDVVAISRHEARATLARVTQEWRSQAANELAIPPDLDRVRVAHAVEKHVCVNQAVADFSRQQGGLPGDRIVGIVTTGKGVTIAVLDTGLWLDESQNYGNRILASIDVTGEMQAKTGDPYGHGTHVTSIAAGGARHVDGSYLGIAPGANVVVVRAFNGEGAGR